MTIAQGGGPRITPRDLVAAGVRMRGWRGRCPLGLGAPHVLGAAAADAAGVRSRYLRASPMRETSLMKGERCLRLDPQGDRPLPRKARRAQRSTRRPFSTSAEMLAWRSGRWLRGQRRRPEFQRGRHACPHQRTRHARFHETAHREFLSFLAPINPPESTTRRSHHVFDCGWGFCLRERSQSWRSFRKRAAGGADWALTNPLWGPRWLPSRPCEEWSPKKHVQ